MQIVALTLWAEARNQPIEGVIAVANVIRNRFRVHLGSASSYADVCLARKQFSCWNDDPTDPNHVAVLKLAAVWQSLPTKETSSAALPQALLETQWIASGILSGALSRDNTYGSKWYMTRTQFATDPKWARGLLPAASIGDHLFFAHTN